jgi:predicted neuraminidase
MPLVLADGGMVLPVYFELSSKYPVALRFDALGNFRGMVRMSQERKVLQPTLLMQSPTQWLALMRDSSSFGRVQASQTQDAGRSWTDLPMLSLHNADNSLAGLSLSATQHVLVHNPQTQGRHELDLSVSADGLQWQEILTLVKGGVADEFSYPSVVWQDQHLWVSYTYKRQAIAWQRLLVKEIKAP